MMRLIALLLCFIVSFSVRAQVDTAQQKIAGRESSLAQQQKPYVILISADGFRYDYARRYHAEHLLALANSGVKATSMIPSFPSITFPNHYTLVTGMYPAHQGIISNKFYDPKFSAFYNYKGKTANEGRWYGGSPLWVLAEQQRMLTAGFYWVGSSADIQHILPSYYYNYNEKISIHQRINTVVEWLKLPVNTRPHLITFYFPQVDHAGHNFGPDAPETEKQVHFVDSAVNELNKAVKATGVKVNFIFVSDHGMVKADNEHPLYVPTAIDTSKFIISGEGVLVELYAKDKKDRSTIQETYDALKKAAKGYTVSLKTNMPAHYHYGAADDRYDRIGDILLIPEPGKIFIQKKNTGVDPGQHGYDPYVMKEMHATFYAWGPAFKQHLTIPPFENVHVFPIITKLLGLEVFHKIDGTSAVANRILKKRNK